MEEQGQRRAVLVGIDLYRHLSGSNLAGCANDARLWAKVLREEFGFSPAGIRMVLNEDATRAGILGALDELAAQTREGDVAVFFYSGHGSSVRDPRKHDLRAETLVPHDSRRGAPASDITEDEVRVRLGRLAERTAHVTFILDCCHSATLHRDPFGERERRIDPGEMELPDPAQRPGPAAAERGGSAFLPPGDRFTLIAACQADETAKEYRPEGGSERHGVLTFMLTQQILASQRRQGEVVTYRDVFERARALVSGTFASQHPIGMGNLDRELFGVRQAPPMRHVLLGRVDGDRVTLDAGAAHGLVAGSRWDVYQQGAKDEREEVIGRIEIDAVGAITASASVIEARGALSPLQRAVEVSRPAAQREAVEVQGEGAHAEEVRALLLRAPQLRSIETGEAGEGPAFLVRPDGDAWVALGRDGREAVPRRPLRDGRGLCADLQTLVNFQRVQALDNPRSRINGKVHVTALRTASGEYAPDPSAWLPARPDGEGRHRYRSGEHLALRVENQHDGPLHVAVLGLMIDRGIVQLFPPDNAPAEVLASQRSSYQGKAPPALYLGIEPYPAMRLSVPAPYKDGVDAIKVLVSTRSFEASQLQQPALVQAGTRGEAEGLQHLLDLVNGAPRRRTIEVQRAVDDWATDMIEIYVSR